MKTIQFKVSEQEYQLYKYLIKEKYKCSREFISDALDSLYYDYVQEIEYKLCNEDFNTG